MAIKRKISINRKEKLDKELNRLISKIIELDVEKIILFGSTATGEIHQLSDIDLIIIKKTSARFLARLNEFYSYLKPRVSIDILVYTPEEFLELSNTSNFIQDAIKKGKIVYER